MQRQLSFHKDKQNSVPKHRRLIENRSSISSDYGNSSNMNIVQMGFRKSLQKSKSARIERYNKSKSMTGFMMSYASERSPRKFSMTGLGRKV